MLSFANTNKHLVAMALIDWHDFVVVETIEFFDDELDLPAPATYEQLLAGVVPAAAEEVRVVEEEMETDEMEMEEDKPQPPPAPQAQVPPPAPVRPPSPPPSQEPELPVLPPPDTKLKILKEPIKRMFSSYQ